MDNNTKPYDLAENLLKFTKKQQQILQAWIEDPALQSGRSIAEALDMDPVTVCAFIRSDAAKQYKLEWFKQNLEWQIAEADHANLLRTKQQNDSGTKAYEAMVKRFGLNPTQQPNVTVNNTGNQPVTAINIVPTPANDSDN